MKQYNKTNTMKEIKVIAGKNLLIRFSQFIFQCAVVWLFLDKFNVSNTNQIWIGAAFAILLSLLIGVKSKEKSIDIFKEGENK